MNTNRYRLVFNRARGVCMAVIWGFVLMPALQSPAWAQSTKPIQADPNAPANLRPGIGQAANGVPLINIQKPSAAGVSRNLYQQFDLQSPGAILNNSRANTPTLLGGWVQGNPNLGQGSARIILNEVNSNQPSLLQGHLETAGPAAQVIIANPAGIHCNGCGFINASRATLTTGNPVLANGQLQGYRVQGGSVTLSGAGLDTSTTPYTDIIARALNLNASLWAQNLAITTGPNTFSLDPAVQPTLAASSSASPSASLSAPSYAIDSSALGGMYAGRIAIIATEAGVGVRHAGKAYATAADLTLHSAGPIHNSGELIGQIQLQLNTPNSLINTGTLSAPQLHINAQNLTNQGSGAQILANNATLFIQNTLDNLSGANIRAQRLAIQAQILNNHGLNNQDRTQAPIIAARQRLDLGVHTLTNLNHALIYSEGDLAIGGSLESNLNTLNTALNITPSTTGQATQITNHGATLQALGNLSLNTQALHNTNANLATVQQRLFQETITEYQAAGSPKRYTPGTPGVAIYNDESDHLQTPEGNFSDWTAYTYTRSTDQTQITQSQPGQIISGGNLTLNADTAHNDNSILMAGAGLKSTVSGNLSGNLSGNVGTLTNTEQTIERTVTDSGTATSYWRHHRRGRDKTGSSTAAYTPAPTTQAIRPDSTTGTPTRAINSTADQSAAHLVALNTSGSIPIAPDTQALALQSPSIQHLIETDPAFTQYRNWLAADPLLRSLKLDNPQLQQYLSEAIRKHQLSFEQITLLARALKAQSGDPGTQDEDEPAKPKSRAKKAAQAAAPTVAQTVAPAAPPAAPPSAPTAPSGLVVGGQAGGLIAGNTINLNIGQTLNNSGTILAQNTLALNTNNLHNHGGNINASNVNLNAAQDLTSSGTLAATQSLQASAGRDLTLASTTQSTRASNTNNTNTRTHIHQQASVRVGNAAGTGSENATNTNTTTTTATPPITPITPITLSLQAGRDLNLNAANLTNQTTGATALTAQANINLGTVDQTQTTQIHWDANNQRSEHRQTAQGSTLQTQSNLSLQAGQDFNAQAATLNSQTGTLQAQAGRNLALQAAQQRTQIDERHQHQGKSGLLAKTTTTRRDTLDQTTAQGSTLSAATINLQAVQNLTLQGSQVVSDQATALQAGNTLNITTAVQTQHQTQQRNTKKTGIFSGGGISLTAGTQAQSLDQTTTTQTAAPSTVGSLQGNTTLQAGQAYQQQGGDILSPQGDIRIAAPSIAITEAREHSTQTTQQQFKQSGITVGLSNPVLTAIDTIQQQKDAAKEAQDPRLKALAAANIALAARGAMKAVTGGKDAKGGNSASPVGGLNLSLSVGKSSSQSHSTVEQDTAQGASLQAGGDVQLLAGIEPAQTPNTTPAAPLTLQGSTVRAGRNLQLSTPGTITAQAAPNTRSQRSTNSSKSGSVGGSIGTDGLLFTASASRGQGKANGFEATWTNTQLQAGQTLNFQSGGNTTLQGVVASATGITAQVGGNLALQSLQDTETYQSQQRSVGGSLAVGAGRGSGSLSSNKADIESDYRSVQDQTRLEAGDAGFDIQVQGNTSLTGAAITSSESAVRGGGNRFNTGSLSTQDLSNSAQYQGKAVGIAFGVGQNSTSSSNTKNASTGAQLNGVGMGKVQGNTSSTTQSAITGVLEPSTSLALHTPLHKTTDFKQLENQLQAQVNITQKFAQEASRTVQRYSDKQRQALQQQLKTNTQELSKEQQEQREQTIRQRISTLNTEERVLNILIGAVTGTGGAAVSQAALSQAADQMRQLMDVDSKKFAGVTDGVTVLGNMTGDSAGVRGDGLKIGGTRVDLDLLCGRSNERCATHDDGSLKLNDAGMIKFDIDAAGGKTMEQFLLTTQQGKDMSGATGGIQGFKGTLFGLLYDPNSLPDRLIEAFSGTHDTVGGKLSGLYDEQGNATRGRSELTKKLQNTWSATGAIVTSTPFAAAELLPPEVWKAISILLTGGK